MYFSVEGDDENPKAILLEEIYEQQEIPRFKSDQNNIYTECKYQISCLQDRYVSKYADRFLNVEQIDVSLETLEKANKVVF